MSRRYGKTIGLLLAAAMSVLWGGPAFGANGNGPAEVSPAVKHDVLHSLRGVMVRPDDFSKWPHSIPLHPLPFIDGAGNQADPVVQSSSVNTAATAGLGFDGVGQGFTGPQGTFSVLYAPPDTNGSVGATQYVQIVNISFAIFDKATGGVLYGPASVNTLWRGFGGGCESNNDGDPVVLYDKAAKRWVVSQFSVSTLPYLQCVAISDTSDATGSWHRYAFSYGNTQFPDYPKLGVWPDAYYITFNIFNNGITFAGAKLCAYDRASMLAGAAATQQCFQLSSSYGGILPADLDGANSPPAGSPNYLLNFGSGKLNLWKFHVDWANPSNTQLTGPTAISVAAFSAACSGGSCIPQAGTSQKLDSLGDRLMYRLAYRNFGDHEALVVNHSVNTGIGNTGVRWYELRNPGTAPVVYQQGTYAPDSNYRWMGSIAMDQMGNTLMGYSVSSSTMHPAIRYAGRAPADPPGTLGSESSIIEGGGSQTANLSRWGDYSSMAIDPVDDCTFWFTSEYLQANGTFNWSTRIASFKFPSCGGTITPDFSLSATPGSQTVSPGGGTSYTEAVTPLGGFTGTVSFSIAGCPLDASCAAPPVTITGSDSASSMLTVTTSSSTPPGTYPLTVTGTSGNLTHTNGVTLVVAAATAGDFSLSASPSTRNVSRGGSTSYTETVTPSGGFTGMVNFSIAGCPPNASCAALPVTITGSSSASSMLTVTTSSSTQKGNYTLTVTGTSGGLTHTNSVNLRVR